MTNDSLTAPSPAMLNKAPEVAILVCVIKILCTTVGDSLADYVNQTLGFGLANTTSPSRSPSLRRLRSSFDCGAMYRVSTSSPSCSRAWSGPGAEAPERWLG